MPSRPAFFSPSWILAAWAALGIVRAQQVVGPEDRPEWLVAQFEVDADVAALFGRVEPEFLRYQQIAFYGNTLASTQPAEEIVDAEVALYRARRASGNVAQPDRSDALLCFNLLLHRPDVGREYLSSIVAGTTLGVDGLVDAAIAVGTMASGSWGERFALAGLDDERPEWRRFWAMFLRMEATEAQTAARLRAIVVDEEDDEVRASLYQALGTIVDRDAVEAIKARFAEEPVAEVRGAMVFAVTEILGRDALAWLTAIEDEDAEVRRQAEASAEYLRTDTTEENVHGYEIGNDPEFVARFADLDTPAIAWLARAGRLEPDAVDRATPLKDDEKAELFDALEASLGFGLEAVKGALFASLVPADLPRLRRLRALAAYSPNSFSMERRRTLLIMIRSLRK